MKFSGSNLFIHTVRRRSGKGSLLVLGAVAIALVVSGCTTTHSASSDGAASNILITPLIIDMTTLDPAMIQDQVTSEVLFNTFECLVSTDSTNQLVPRLAESWDLSPDKKTYTFHIRHGVKFHNGRELVASDFKFSWERALSHDLHSPTAPNYLAGVVGVQEVVDGKATEISGVKVVDPYTLSVTIDKPRAFFLMMLTYPTNVAVCKEALDKTGGKMTVESMVGTGPFTMTSYQPGQKLVMKANANYWGTKPKLAGIEYPVILQPDTLYQNYVTGKVDFCSGGITAAQYVQDKQAGKFADQYSLPPTATLDYLVMHPGLQPAFAKIQVRKAIAMAIDRDTIIRVAHHGITRRADSVLPPELPSVGATPNPIPYDPAQAKQLLTQAGYPGGKGFPTLTLTFQSSSPRVADSCQLIRSNLKDNLGIEVSLQPMESGQFYREGAQERTLSFYYTGWVADYPDPQDFITTLFASTSPLDHVGYKNPKFDALCALGDAESDPKKRGDIYAQANQILMDEVGALPIAFSPRIMLCHKNVTGWQTNLAFLLPHINTTKSGNP